MATAQVLRGIHEGAAGSVPTEVSDDRGVGFYPAALEGSVRRWLCQGLLTRFVAQSSLQGGSIMGRCRRSGRAVTATVILLIFT